MLPTDYRLSIDLEREEDGRWIADLLNLPGALAYGETTRQAINKALDIWEKESDLA